MHSVDLTFRRNLDKGRHGWIRLTPAYSITLVENIINELSEHHKQCILDPFSGTGTTGLVSAQYGIPCDLFEINPFLSWLAKTKTRQYTKSEIDSASKATSQIVRAVEKYKDEDLWFPNMNRISRWWNPPTLNVLARVFHGIKRQVTQNREPVTDLLKIAFCRILIAQSNAAFNHQSMSFKKEQNEPLFKDRVLHEISESFESTIKEILRDAAENPIGQVNVFQHNSKTMPPEIRGKYSCIITSPPYANRISYVREVRPYMYWLGFISEARQASDLEWNATGGTWGVATSRLSTWTPQGLFKNDTEFLGMIDRIKPKSTILANYVHRYFEDMYSHFSCLGSVLKERAQVHYIIGNSKFYDVMVPTEEIYVKILENNGFENIRTTRLRKRSSKKELFEYEISGSWHRLRQED